MRCACGKDMRPKYRDDGFHYFHVFECVPACGFRTEIARPHEEWLENQRAMRALDNRDCRNIGGGFNYGRGR